MKKNSKLKAIGGNVGIIGTKSLIIKKEWKSIMDYGKIYHQLMERAKNRTLDGYTEQHHIIPKCMGGSNNNDNLVKLTAREHFLAHWLLARIYPDVKGIITAFWFMSNRRGFKVSARTYAEAKEMHYMQLLGNANAKGRVHTDESRRKMSDAIKRWYEYNERSDNHRSRLSQSIKKHYETAKSPRFGVTLSDDVKRKLSISKKKFLSNNDNPMKNKTHSDYARRIISEKSNAWYSVNNHPNKGLSLPDDVKGRMVQAWTQRSVLQCPHCGKTGRANMKRYHFDNCKHKDS